MAKGEAMFLSVTLRGPHHVAQVLLPQAVWHKVRTLSVWDDRGITLIHIESRHKYTRLP